jgi:hypothetical protein
MPRIAIGLLVGVASLWASASAQANWFKCIYHDIHSGFHTNNMWPQPYVEPARKAVREPLAVMYARGWQRYNLLGAHHFEEGQNRLTDAGKLRVKAILANSPPQHRTVFVEKGLNREITNARIDSIQQAIVELQTEGPLPAVMASDLIVEGWSSEYVDAVGRKYHQSIPQPRLPNMQGASAGGP